MINGAASRLSRRLDSSAAALYREWIANRRHLEDVIAEMHRISAEAADILLRRPTGS